MYSSLGETAKLIFQSLFILQADMRNFRNLISTCRPIILPYRTHTLQGLFPGYLVSSNMLAVSMCQDT